MTHSPSRWALWRRRLWLLAALLLYFILTCYQLGLPGLHYDEAREAGVNAMEILTGAPVTLFRDTGLTLFGRSWPLMVQDYIGALNVYLALPLLWLTGIGVPNLRFIAVLTGAVTLLLLERTVTEWLALSIPSPEQQTNQSLTSTGLLAVTLLVASPSFVFWSRQGLFVTNLTQPLVFAALWQGLRWLRTGRGRCLAVAAFWGGCALYAKLLAIWIIGPFVLLAAGWWLWRGHLGMMRPPLSFSLFLGAIALFLLPLSPLLWFNFQNGGTISTVASNLGTSYYGVNNLAIWSNLLVRLAQARAMIVGDHFWYLGGLYGNRPAGWATMVLLCLGALFATRSRQLRPLLLMPLFLLLLTFAASLFTVSDLFVTHYALLQPLTIAVTTLALHALSFTRLPRISQIMPKIGYLLASLWLAFDLTASVRYHRALTASGGLADHADTSYHLAYYLQYNGLGAPVALDWGFDAPVRYLSRGTVTPLELFGYASPQQPDADFADRLRPFLANSNNVYLLHTPSATVFQGRRAIFLQLVSEQHQQAQVAMSFRQRDGTPLYELWRVRDAND